MKKDGPAARPARGRPRSEASKRRNRRLVTFVTDSEYARLQQLASESDRALSFVVHLMIERQLGALEDEHSRRSD